MPLMGMLEAIKNGDAQRAAELLSADRSLASGATPDGVSYISFAMYHRKPEIANMLAAERTDLNFAEACTLGNTARVQELLTAHPESVNRFSVDGFAPVALAAYFGHPDIVELLIAAGANVNAQAQNAMKVAAIHAAVSARAVRCVEILLENGADPNLPQQEGITPLRAAQMNNDEAIIALLTAAGAR